MSIQPASTYHGQNAVRDTSRGLSPTTARPAPAGMPYVGDVRCAANNGTCGAPRAKETELCIGHLRQLMKAQGVAGEQE